MFTEYKKLPQNSRVWVYQSDREFTQEEIEFISAKALLFIDNWTRHGDDLKGSFTIKYNQFLILGVDENFNNVSGCSIDASVRFIQELEKELELDLMDKMNVSFKDGDNINIVKLPEFQNFAKEQKVTAETVVFNNMVNTKEDFEKKWEVSANESWHARFLV
ncbi:ABC transporter ATPase [Tenacibaculum discolor]|uniref:ABC transporter ATPase n=1 Tax=Tenacibaculum discolor TaxID=361581 RepID=A0A2G1BRD7_9FLAO|nr:ABC transporter ATPase [Tenacibaculum discolor]MDP2540837.1 ABC transporter ATPase [Tenacibaculum discolor]PHN96587.1 ABC transporter ATPase [Tenacibaculum discolor]PHN99749.1 ABC transporter ATPase [Rhodobacteraceae bacterium 4F10]